MAETKGKAAAAFEPFLRNPYQTTASVLLLAYFIISQNALFAAIVVAAVAALYAAERYGGRGEGERGLIGDALGKRLERINNSKILYVVLVLSLVIFILAKKTGLLGIFFGVAGGAALVALVVIEIMLGLWKGGLRNEVKESVSALLLALVVWFGLSLALGVQSPINAIVSCSMVPQLERGDMVLLAGGEPSAPEIAMSREEIAAIGSRGIVRYGEESFEVNGSLFFHCLNRRDERCAVFLKEPSAFLEQHGPLTFRYSLCKRVGRGDGRSVLYPCVSSLEYKGRVIAENISNDVVVYQSPAEDLFALQGDTIHRVFARIRDEDGKGYLLTKGDNNHYFDLQAYAGGGVNRGNSLVRGGQVKGKVVAGVPYLGYLKLFLSGLTQPAILGMDEGCDTVFEKFKR